jgi:hypothetical protein
MSEEPDHSHFAAAHKLRLPLRIAAESITGNCGGYNIIPSCLREQASGHFAIGYTYSDDGRIKQPIHLLEVTVMEHDGLGKHHILAVNGYLVIEIDGHPVPPTFFAQDIKSIKELLPEESPFYREFAPRERTPLTGLQHAKRSEAALELIAA